MRRRRWSSSELLFKHSDLILGSEEVLLSSLIVFMIESFFRKTLGGSSFLKLTTGFILESLKTSEKLVSFHLEGLKAGGEKVPGAGTVVEWVEV